MLRCSNVCNEKNRKLGFLMLFVNLALENGRNMDFPMPIEKTTYCSQYQWKKYKPFLILDLSVDMPNVEKLALSQRPFVTIFSHILFTYAQGLSKRSTSVASLLRSPSINYDIFLRLNSEAFVFENSNLITTKRQKTKLIQILSIRKKNVPFSQNLIPYEKK